MQYYQKPSTINISAIKNKFHSLHPTEHRIAEIPTRNYKILNELCDKEDVGSQIDVSEYLPFKTNFYLQTISCMEGTIINEKAEKNISPLLYDTSNKKVGVGEFCISRNASIGKISYIPEDINAIVNGGISFFKFKEKYNYYIPAFFITNYGEDTLKCMTSGGGTQQNVKRDTLLNFKIPFPLKTKKNSQEEIINYISDLVKCIIDKEIVIKKKVDKIDSIIDSEMSKKRMKAQYTFPSINEIRVSGNRLDTGVYGKKYKDVINDIKSYQKGYRSIGEMKYKWVSGRTPEIIISNDSGKYWWIAVGDMSYGLKYKSVKRYNTSEHISNILIDGDILVTRKGATVGKMNMFFNDLNIPTFVNEDIKVLRLDENMMQKVFVGMFLNSKYGQIQMLNLASRGTKQGLTNDNILNVIIPSFSKKTKGSILKEFYNTVENKWDKSMSFVDYENLRNIDLGIYQINMEMFKLKKKIELVVSNVIENKAIDVDYSF